MAKTSLPLYNSKNRDLLGLDKLKPTWSKSLNARISRSTSGKLVFMPTFCAVIDRLEIQNSKMSKGLMI